MTQQLSFPTISRATRNLESEFNFFYFFGLFSKCYSPPPLTTPPSPPPPANSTHTRAHTPCLKPCASRSRRFLPGSEPAEHRVKENDGALQEGGALTDDPRQWHSWLSVYERPPPPLRRLSSSCTCLIVTDVCSRPGKRLPSTPSRDGTYSTHMHTPGAVGDWRSPVTAPPRTLPSPCSHVTFDFIFICRTDARPPDPNGCRCELVCVSVVGHQCEPARAKLKLSLLPFRLFF